ncbi:MAG: hypothetical protein GVY20_04920 [Bacteroidetes bacterium]|nr:hypothetical protein [Bacteroidota bacterium]
MTKIRIFISFTSFLDRLKGTSANINRYSFQRSTGKSIKLAYIRIEQTPFFCSVYPLRIVIIYPVTY